MVCYSDPLEEIIVLVYPIQDPLTGDLNWVFDASNIQFVSPIFSSQVNYTWQFTDDPLVQNYIQN